MTHDGPPHARGRWMGFLAHRWPTALGAAVATLTAFDLRIDVESVSSLSALVFAMPLVYVGAVVVDRRRFAWAVLLAAIAALVLTQALDLKINLTLVFLVAALAFLVLGRHAGSCADQAASRSRPPGCLFSARPPWRPSTWI